MRTNTKQPEKVLQRYNESLNNLKDYLEQGDINLIAECLQVSARTVSEYLKGNGKVLGKAIRINNALTKLLEERSISVD